MSMSNEHAEQLKNEFAIVCCRNKKEKNFSCKFKDPIIFPDMVIQDS